MNERKPRLGPLRGLVVAVSLLAPFVGTLWVSSYAEITPRLGGFPYFYWYQLLWVPISAGCTTVAYVLVNRVERARRAARAEGGEETR